MAFEVTFNDKQEAEFRAYVSRILREQLEQIKEDERTAKPILNRKDAAEWLGVTVSTIDAWKVAGLPVSIINNRPFFAKADILEFINQHKA